jgi:glycerophosphoryl diester phosphodiesterase
MPQEEYRPWLIAHRGAREQAPENTRTAFERALDYPIDGLELDVRMSADGTPVIFHDDSLRRVTGRRERIEDLTFAQLEGLDWGGWFHPDFSGEPLLTLEQTLALFGGRTRLLIEIKSSAAQQRSGHAGRLARRVLELLAGMPAHVPADHISILSFDPDVLRLVAHLAPQWRCVLNVPELNPLRVLDLPREDIDRLWAVDVRIGRLSAPLSEWARDRGLRVLTYTCNTPSQVEKALGLKVDGILTDRPGWIVNRQPFAHVRPCGPVRGR